MGRYDYGYRHGGGYWGADWAGPPRREMARGRPDERYDRRMRPEGRDEWWLGGHHPGRYDEPYDRVYREFDERNRPHFSPVGGTYHAMGGMYDYRRPPRPLRDEMWFSDWTRWF
jgi:hypothetical protein